jgi:lipopolysaccharide transport system ATP-binding protein
MSSRIAISIDNVSKTYRLGAIGSQTLQEDLQRLWAKLRGRPDPLVKIGQETHARQVGATFWALDRVSFDVTEGGVIGIIGHNGAGKSTLLKILSQVTVPTSGSVKIRGRIASLLEVGTGFHPDLTGRENIFLNGAILGMTRAEIHRKLDEIVEFSGVARFIDTPVKRYSSGMYVRLAFAVAAHLEPEILVVDEVLAVGDAEFQAKCLGKMDEVSRKQGRTVLFVSHNMDAVLSLTREAVMLADGRVAMQGPSPEVVSAYLRGSGGATAEYIGKANGVDPAVTRVRIHTSLPGNVQFHGEPMEIECEVDLPNANDKRRFELTACDERGRQVMYMWKYDTHDEPIARAAGRYRIRCRVPDVRLFAGRYTITASVAERFGSNVRATVTGVCPFEVVMKQVRDGGWKWDSPAFIERGEWSFVSATESPAEPSGTLMARSHDR